MFNTLPGLTRAFSFGKIITGLSKTLNIANQVIPIYLKARPIIANAKSTLGMLKEFTTKNSTSDKPSKTISPNPVKNDSQPIKKVDNEPTFFL